MASPRTVSPLLLALACGPETPADSADTDTTTSPATTTGTTTPDPGTTPAQPTTTGAPNPTSDTTGPPPPPIRGEWVGTYSMGFGFYHFVPCGSDEQWWVEEGLPAYLSCHQQPLWLRIQGVLSFDNPDDPSLTVEAVLDGPCTEGTCDGAPFGGCNSFDALCQNHEQECDLFVKTCPPDTKCTFVDPDTFACVAVSDDGLPAGSPCTTGMGGTDDCDATSVCWDGDPDTDTGTCMAYCTGTQDAAQCTDPDAVCAEFAPDVFRLCIPRCDPLVQDCPMGQLCSADQSLFRCVPDQSSGLGLPAAPCDTSAACNPGLFCANPPLVPGCEPIKAGCCSEFCDQDAPNCSLPGQTCVPWFSEGEEIPPELADLGACVLPP